MIYQYLWYPIFPNRHWHSQWEGKFSCFNFHKNIFEDRITSFVFLVINHDMIPFELAIVFYNIFYEHTYVRPTGFAQFLPFITVVHQYLHTWPFIYFSWTINGDWNFDKAASIHWLLLIPDYIEFPCRSPPNSIYPTIFIRISSPMRPMFVTIVTWMKNWEPGLSKMIST